MSVSVTCPKCQMKLQLEENRLGKYIKCPGCAAVFHVTAPAAATPTPGVCSDPPSPSRSGGEPARNLADVVWDFDARLRDGKNPRIQDCLESLDDPARRLELLMELIRCELSFRRGTPGILEERLAQFDELRGSPQHVASLIRHEYRERLRGGEAPAQNEYLQRFPAYRDEIGTFSEATDQQATPAPASWSAALPPELRDHPQYEGLRELGRGGMGVVYLAKNKLMNRAEVLKVVNPQLFKQPGLEERFLREIRAAAQLRHPNIATAYAALQIGDLLVLAMEYVEGDNLAQVVKARGPLPVVNACYYVQQTALGLQHAFEKGMVHRDIKPSNLILAREGKKHIVKILDFGLAKATREKELTGYALTGTGQVLGTPDFMAPEQAEDAARADIRADIYSLGCTLYFLLTGRPPFQAKSLYGLLHAHAATPATPLDEVRKDVPAELAAVVAKMMAKDPAQRYQKPVGVAQALGPFVRKVLGSLSAVAPTPPPPGGQTVLKEKLGRETVVPGPAIAATRTEGEATIAKAAKKAARDEDEKEDIAKAPRRRRPVREEEEEDDDSSSAWAKPAKDAVYWPAVSVLLIFAILCIVPCVILLIVGFGGNDTASVVAALIGFWLSAMLLTPLSIGGIQTIRLRSYRWAWFTAIVPIIVGLSSVWYAGAGLPLLAVGIWLAKVLRKPQVRVAFARLSRASHPEKGQPWPEIHDLVGRWVAGDGTVYHFDLPTYFDKGRGAYAGKFFRWDRRGLKLGDAPYYYYENGTLRLVENIRWHDTKKRIVREQTRSERTLAWAAGGERTQILTVVRQSQTANDVGKEDVWTEIDQ